MASELKIEAPAKVIGRGAANGFPFLETHYTTPNFRKAIGKMNLTVFNHGKTAINLDEVRMINGSAIIFKNDPKVYDIGEEAANAVHQMFNSSSREPQPTPRDKSPTPQPSDPSQPSQEQTVNRE